MASNHSRAYRGWIPVAAAKSSAVRPSASATAAHRPSRCPSVMVEASTPATMQAQYPGSDIKGRLGIDPIGSGAHAGLR